MQVDLDPRELRARGLAADDVVNAISSQNLILPAGTEKIDTRGVLRQAQRQPDADRASSTICRSGLRNGSVVYVRDVAHVRDGYPPQTNIARVDGKRAVLMNVLKTGNASTIDIINGINERLPGAGRTMPPDLKLVRIERPVDVRARRHLAA